MFRPRLAPISSSWYTPTELMAMSFTFWATLFQLFLSSVRPRSTSGSPVTSATLLWSPCSWLTVVASAFRLAGGV